MTLSESIEKIHQGVRTMERNNAEDEDNRQGHNHDRINLEPRGLVSVQFCHQLLAINADTHLSIMPQPCIETPIAMFRTNYVSSPLPESCHFIHIRREN
jgi:hypothetical protein